MAIKGLETTYLYGHLNKTNGITNNIVTLMQGITITKEHIEEPYITINKNFKFPLKYKVLDAFKDGSIILKYSKGNKLPTCMPFFLTKVDGRVVAIVAVDIYGTLDEENNSLNIDAKKLYCLMEGAYLARLIYLNNAKIPTRSVVISSGSEIYSSVFTRVLNKKYALNVDKTKMNKVRMLTSKFYMINMLGLEDSDMVFNYAIKNCPTGNIYSLKEANDAFNPDAYKSLDAFITELATNKALGLNFKDLTVRGYLEAYINMYDSSTLLALECFPYFMYMIVCVVDGGYMNNQYVLEDLVDKNGSRLYVDLAKLDD
jgi:hypothetical protein